MLTFLEICSIQSKISSVISESNSTSSTSSEFSQTEETSEVSVPQRTETAESITASGLSLEEYYGITSDYALCVN